MDQEWRVPHGERQSTRQQAMSRRRAPQQPSDKRSNDALPVKIPTGIPSHMGRQRSLRHAKDSRETLQQRSVSKINKDVPAESSTVPREGRQFTVGSVGNNGRIYLR